MTLINMELSTREISIAFNALKERERQVEEWINEATTEDALITFEEHRKQIRALSIKLKSAIEWMELQERRKEKTSRTDEL